MKLKKEWSNWKVFLVSLVPAIILTPILEPLYLDFFGYSGSGLLPVEISTYPGTAALLYIFLITFLFTGLAKNFKGINLFYFVIIPFFLLIISGNTVLVAGSLIIILGLFLGKLIRNKLRKEVRTPVRT